VAVFAASGSEPNNSSLCGLCAGRSVRSRATDYLSVTGGQPEWQPGGQYLFERFALLLVPRGYERQANKSSEPNRPQQTRGRARSDVARAVECSAAEGDPYDVVRKTRGVTPAGKQAHEASCLSVRADTL
jgi:hypothetical protein